MHQAVFVLSTGRCGTQWLAQQLANATDKSFYVCHEPLHNDYHPRDALVCAWQSPPTTVDNPVLQAHIEKIREILKHHHYLECGHPCWSSLPQLIRALDGQVKIIHLLRDPVKTSFSWLTHNAYQQPILPHLSERVLLSPFDQGVQYPHYQQHWNNMSPYQKCLFYWLEVNAFGKKLKQVSGVDWLTCTFESALHERGLQDILQFIGSNTPTASNEHSHQQVDNFRYLSPIWQDWQQIFALPECVELAQDFGYQLDNVDEEQLRQRYLGQ